MFLQNPFSTLLASYRSETPLFQAPMGPSIVPLRFLENCVFQCILFNGTVFSQLECQSSSGELCLPSHGHFTPSKALMQFHCSHLHLIAMEANSLHVSRKPTYLHGVSLHCTTDGANLSASTFRKRPTRAFPQTVGGHTACTQACTQRWPGAVLQKGDICLVPCCPPAIPGAQHPRTHFRDCFSLLGQSQLKDGWSHRLHQVSAWSLSLVSKTGNSYLFLFQFHDLFFF